MNFAEKRKAVESLSRRIRPSADAPGDVVELIIFHMLHLQLPLKAAEAAFQRLKRSFVDWNEVRVSAAGEIEAVLGNARNVQSLAQSIKAFLGDIHRDRHQTSLEFLNEATIAQARKYLRSLGAVEPATIDLFLRLKKAQAVVPLEKDSERVLVRMGVVPSGFTSRQKQKFLQRLVPEDLVVVFHRSVVDLARGPCREDEVDLRCEACPVRHACSYNRRSNKGNGTRRRTS